MSIVLRYSDLERNVETIRWLGSCLLDPKISVEEHYVLVIYDLSEYFEKIELAKIIANNLAETIKPLLSPIAKIAVDDTEIIVRLRIF